MIPKLSLDGPRWLDFDGVTAEEVNALVEQMASTAATGAGDEWRQAWAYMAEGLVDDGIVSEGAYAALPHLVEAAAALPPGRSVDFWVDLGLIVTADYRPPVPADLEAGFGAALRLAERAAVQSLLAGNADPEACAHLVLSCVAFAGHHMGGALGRLLDPKENGLLLVCPGCGSDTEIPDFFVDPVRPAFEAPELPEPLQVRQGEHPWGDVASAVREEALGEGWEPFLRVARRLAETGLPPEAPGQAVLCLVAGVVAVTVGPPRAGREWARELMMLTGYFRCWDCERTWTIADGLTENPAGAHPQNHVATVEPAFDGSAATVESAAADRPHEAATRFRQDGNALLAGDGSAWGHVSVFSESEAGAAGGVDALTVVTSPGWPPLVAGGGDTGVVRLWSVDDGRLAQELLPGHPDRIRSMTALTLPDGRTLLASGGDSGTIALWNPLTGQPVREPVGNWPGGVTGMCTATVPDGRTLLVTATPRGAVLLWDPLAGEPVGRLNPYGSPIQSIAAVPISDDHTLIAATDTGGRVHVWDPAVDDPWERGAAVQLSAQSIKDLDHRVVTVAAVATLQRTVLATGDNRGVVMLWDPATGAPIGDGLPASTGTAGLPLITGTTLPDGRTVLATGSKSHHRLRIWEPETGAVRHIALDVTLTCLATTGRDLIVGHARGVLKLPLTRQ
ncbi:WD40 repeat domain-containing protein [Streptomyces griseorubiginosus]|uniref:WD40 repeat domain-containing protein n=1 Tax=Streptomyces griseorubiginosus TaxID=67304 RepID=UPI0036F06EEF